jgi:hypothetical protein
VEFMGGEADVAVGVCTIAGVMLAIAPSTGRGVIVGYRVGEGCPEVTAGSVATDRGKLVRVGVGFR